MYSIDSFNVAGVSYALRDAMVREEITASQTTDICSVRIRVDDVQIHTPIQVVSSARNLLEVLRVETAVTLKGDAGGEVVIRTDGGLECNGIWSREHDNRILELFSFQKDELTGPLTLSFDTKKSTSTNVCAELTFWVEDSEGFQYDWGIYYIDADMPSFTFDSAEIGPGPGPELLKVYAYVYPKDTSLPMSGIAYFQLEHGDAASGFAYPGNAIDPQNALFRVAGKNMLWLPSVGISTRDVNSNVSYALVKQTTDGVLWKTGGTYYVRIPCDIPRGLRISGSYKSTGTGDNSVRLMRAEYENGELAQVSPGGLVTKEPVKAIYLYKENVKVPLTEDVYITEIQVEIGKRSTAYEPYRDTQTVSLVQDPETGRFYIPADAVHYTNCTIYPAVDETYFAGHVEYRKSIVKYLENLATRIEALERAILNL